MLIVVLLVIDQWIKITVKTTMPLNTAHEVAPWFYIHFIENNGMAYGMSFIPKPLLTTFRFAEVVLLSVYLWQQVRRGARWLYVTLLAMLIAGATGNLIDCLLYKVCFTTSTPFAVSYFAPDFTRWADYMNGRVVDMFSFPFVDTYLPAWVPIWGGERYIFFQPIFNFADACVSTSVVAAFLFCRKELSQLSSKAKQ